MFGARTGALVVVAERTYWTLGQVCPCKVADEVDKVGRNLTRSYLAGERQNHGGKVFDKGGQLVA